MRCDVGHVMQQGPEADIVIVDETEEDTLRKIFESGAPQQQQNKRQQQQSSGTTAAAAGQQPSPPRYIELKLGKQLTIRPEQERSLSIALRQPVRKKYRLSRHFDFFAKFQDRIEMTMELINGTSVQVSVAELASVSKFQIRQN